ncbi:putative ankyrin repeat protein RF_0381 [Coccinella septempunctata]|uniref:putative ankyrin repeat protein RF_0381 n=1 Tax=Coccinella septempunctata TaxID=41139 RepID=UPI001D06EF1E|nr:putative ankyrin repeat protein RF_0381 [Coccinella septempunctata]
MMTKTKISPSVFVHKVKYNWSFRTVADFLRKSCNSKKKTALELLVGSSTRHGSREKLVMCLLLKNGADPLKKCKSGGTIIQKILRNRDSSLIIKFLEYVKDINMLHGGSTALHIAVERQIKDLVKYILGRNPEINKESDSHQNTPLHDAVTLDSVEITEILLENGANIEARDIKGQTPLHWALDHNNSFDQVRMLVMNGADVNSKDNGARTPLHTLCCNGLPINFAIYELLLQKVSDINAADERGSTPILNLIWTLKPDSPSDNEKLINLLLQCGSNLNQQDHVFGSALHAAAFFGRSVSFIRFLIEKGADTSFLNRFNETFIECMLNRDSSSEVEELLKWMFLEESRNKFEFPGSLLDLIRSDEEMLEFAELCKQELRSMKEIKLNKDDYFSLYTVMTVNERVLAKFFRIDPSRIRLSSETERFPIYGTDLERNHLLGWRRYNTEISVRNLLTEISDGILDYDAIDEILKFLSTEDIILFQKTVLELLVGDKKFHCSRDKLVMCLLLEHGANPLHECGDNQTIMQKVFRNKDSKLIIKFLEYVEDVNIFLGEFTVLIIAVRRHLTDVVEYTIGRNAEINKKCSLSQSTALHEAVQYDTVAITRILLENGADLEARDRTGQTPLHWALGNSLDQVKILVENGADINSTDIFGRTPLHTLCSEGLSTDFHTCEFLLQKVADTNAADINGATPLHTLMRYFPVACTSRNEKLVNLFLKYGANLNRRDNFFGTILHAAAFRNHSVRFLLFLIQKGADTSILNRANETFINCLARCTRSELIRCLFVEEFKKNFEFNEHLLTEIRSDIQNFELEKSCRKELSILKDQKLKPEDSLSLFMVMSADEKVLAKCFRYDPSRIEITDLQTNQFPIYGLDLERNHKTGIERFKAEISICDFLSKQSENILDLDSIDEIVRFISTKEMNLFKKLKRLL